MPLNIIKVLIEEILAVTFKNDSLPGTPHNPRLRSIAAERRGTYISNLHIIITYDILPGIT